MTRSPRAIKQQVHETVGEQVRDLPLHAVRLAMFGVGRALVLGDRVTRDYKEIKEGGGVRPVLDRLRSDVQSTTEDVVERIVGRIRGPESEAEAEPAPTGGGTRTTTTRTTTQTRTTTSAGTGAASPVPSPTRTAEREIAVGKPGARPKPRPTPGSLPKPESRPAPGSTPKPASKAKPTPTPTPTPEPTSTSEPLAKPAPTPRPADTTEPVARPATDPSAKPSPKRKASELPVPDYDAASIPQLRARLRGLSIAQVELLRQYEEQHAARPDVIRMYENRIIKLNGNS